MPTLSKKRRLKKEIGLLGVYSIATGTTLSAGFFLLPGLAAQVAGPALVLAYMLAAIPLIPAMFSKVELSTAMPRAGGVYYFLDRSLGPLVGTVGGVGTWLALMLKVAFALVGMSAYLRLFLPDLQIRPVAVFLAVALGLVNYIGAKLSGFFQVLMVAGLLVILAAFTGVGMMHLEVSHFQNFLAAGTDSIIATAGLVYISYVGVTKVASLSEEVRDPERNIPRGIFLALATALLIYFLGTLVIVGLVPMDELKGSLTPVAAAAGLLAGQFGIGLVSVAALLAFTSVANAGILSASRYPLAMSRDRLLPRFFRRLDKSQSPVISLGVTVALIILLILLFDPTKIAKLASAFQLVLFALICLAVIVMRESRIESYDPGYRSPLYPWMQLLGLFAPLGLIFFMGPLAILFSLGLVVAGALWYWFYARQHTVRSGAIYHVLRRLADHGLDPGLDRELRSILREKGLRDEDPFDQVVARASALDLEEEVDFETVVSRVSSLLAEDLPPGAATAEELAKGFLEGTRIGATPVSKGVSLPHLRLVKIDEPEMVLVRSKAGFRVDVMDVHGDHRPDDLIHACFFLVSPEADPRQHLRILAQIAERVDDEGFLASWLAARNQQVLKEILLADERFLSLRLRPGSAAAPLIGKALRELDMPDGALVAMVRRDGETLVPRGRTVLKAGDRLTILGEPAQITLLRDRFSEKS